MSNFSGMTFVIILLIFILLISLVRLASTVVTFSAIIILVFGAIRGFKNALGSVISIQHEWARAMRTANDDTMLMSQMLERVGTEGTAAMIKFGIEAKTVGEVLYKLGSAGLKASESLAALDSTMSMIVGTEANITQATNLVASIYNNFSDNIVGVTNLQEKFKYINDVITATFEYHQ
jgi:hypothetical protein